MPPFCLIPLIFGDFLLSPLLGLSLQLCLVVSLGVPTLSSETMPSDLPCTVALDVSKFPATASRVDISSAIVRLFSAYKVNAVQFVGNSARVTFSSASDREAVMRFESVRVGDVDCVVRGGGPGPQKVLVYSYPVEGNLSFLTDALSRYGEVHDVRFRHWLRMSEVADGVRVVSMVRNQAIPRNLVIDGYHCKVSYYGQAKECDICEKTGHIARDCPFRGKCLRCGQAGHLYRDCRREPVAATPGPPELPVDPEDNQTGEAMESDSLVNRTVLNASALPVEFVPASVFSSDGFLPVRRRAKRKRARIFESTDIGSSDDLGGGGRFSPGGGNVDNCAVNDCDTASCENGETVNIIIGDVNSASNNIVCGDAGNSCVANHSTASINDNSSDKNISCVVSENSHTSNVNSSKDGNVSSNSNSSDTVNNCTDNNNNDSCGFSNSNNVTCCAASCSGVNNDISGDDAISSCVASDNATNIIGNDNSCAVSGNSNSSNVNSCKNDKNVAIDNASSSNNSSIISNIACNTIPDDNVLTNVNDKMDMSNVSDNMGNLNNDNDCSITWDDVVAMEYAARDLEEVPAPASPYLVCPSKACTARRSDRLQQSFIPRRLTRASTKSKS